MAVNKKDKEKDKLTGNSSVSQWGLALQDARRKLSESQARSRQLRNSIGIIEGKIQAGEPWPNDKSAQN